jgi:RNA polymerase sigma factor (sigma-70 family)
MTPQSLLAPARLAGRQLLGTQSDERLVDLVRAGNELAFEAIVARYHRGLLRYVGRLLADGRADDVVQQAFVNSHRAMLRDDSELNLRPWLYRIAHNLALNALRDRGPRLEPLPEDVDGVERPDEALERRQGLREVLAAVKSLPERQRSALVLRELEGRSYDEIAVELGVTGGAVRQLLSRARHAVRAGATALTPAGLVARLPWGIPTEPLAARVAELCGAGAAGAAAVKFCTGALVTGAVATGVAVAPDVGPQAGRDASARPAVSAPRADAPDPAGTGTADARPALGGDGGWRARARREGEDDSSGPGSGGDGSSSGSSGSGSGSSGSGSGSSGSGSGSSGSGSDSSGSGSSGSGSHGSGSGSSGSGSSGSGSGRSGSGSSGPGSSGSGSGSGSSGSGSSGSGPGSSGSGSSGSGSDGSGSSGSGSGSSGSGSGSSGSDPETADADSSGSGSGDGGSGGEGDSGGESGSSG